MFFLIIFFFAAEPEWRLNPLSQRLAFAYTNQLFTDIDISLISSGEEYRFKAHRCILAHFSPKLEKIIYIGAVDKSHIKLYDMDPEGFSFVLR